MGGSGYYFDLLLAQHGFAVLHVDNRGMGARGRDFEQAAYRNFGPVQLSDQLAAIDQVLEKYPQLDKNRLGWWGWSHHSGEDVSRDLSLAGILQVRNQVCNLLIG